MFLQARPLKNGKIYHKISTLSSSSKKQNKKKADMDTETKVESFFPLPFLLTRSH